MRISAVVLSGLFSLGMVISAASAAGVAPLPEKGFEVAWKTDLRLSSGIRAVHVMDEWIFVYTTDNSVGAVKRQTGTGAVRVKPAAAGERLAPPVVVKEGFVFPTDTKLLVYDFSGTFVRTRNLRTPMRSTAVGNDTTVYVGIDTQEGGRIAAFGIEAGDLQIGPQWQREPRGQVSAKPAFAEGMLFVGSRDGRIYGLTAEYGRVAWPRLRDTEYGFQTGGPILAALEADRTCVYAASMDSKLYCLDINTGRLRWEYYAGHELNTDSAPVATNDTVYIYVPRTGIVAVDKAETGPIARHKWVKSDAVQFLAQDDKYAYLLRRDYTIMAVSKDAGEDKTPEVKFTNARRDFAAFGTNRQDGIIYATTKDGELYAIKAITKPGAMGEVAAAAPETPLAIAAR